MEGEKEGEGDFKCLICSSTVAVKEGRFHCKECDIDVCKPCFESSNEDKPEDSKEEKGGEKAEEQAPKDEKVEAK